MARLLSAVSISGDPVLAQMTLAGRFVRLVEAVADLRNAQQRAAQAAAARQAAEHLYAAMPGHAGPAARRRVTTRTAAERNRIEFPFPPGMVPPQTEPLADAYRSTQSGPSPSYSPDTPSPRSPDR
jgi:hypothetical protein